MPVGAYSSAMSQSANGWKCRKTSADWTQWPEWPLETNSCPAGLITSLPPHPSAWKYDVWAPGDAGARVTKHRRAIITASRVAARRRHLAGCQTHWGPPSNSSRQNKGSVRNTDSCNISPGPGSHSINQNRRREIFFSLANGYEHLFGLLPTQLLSWQEL